MNRKSEEKKRMNKTDENKYTQNMIKYNLRQPTSSLSCFIIIHILDPIHLSIKAKGKYEGIWEITPAGAAEATGTAPIDLLLLVAAEAELLLLLELVTGAVAAAETPGATGLLWESRDEVAMYITTVKKKRILIDAAFAAVLCFTANQRDKIKLLI